MIALSGWLSDLPAVYAQDKEQDSQHFLRGSRIKIGFEVAPVPLNLTGKDHDLVGLGSYWVNVIASCNDCHTAGGPPNYNYAAGGNPYFGQPKKTDPTTYLAAGTDFGPALPPGFYAPGYGSYLGPDIVSRNLTPDKTGLPEGVHTFEHFLEIIRTGVDMDHQHPICTTVSPTPIRPTAFRLRSMEIFSRSCPGLAIRT
jgi:hypothetical protein